MKPKRIQRKRTKGWKMPPNTVYVGRPTVYGNPFKHFPSGRPREEILHDFRQMIENGGNLIYPQTWQIREELRGKDLACWCPLSVPCHADVLLEIANR